MEPLPIKIIEGLCPIDNKEYSITLFEPWQLMERINAELPGESTRYAVNFGCGDGKAMNDPVYPLYQRGYAGLAVEGEENKDLPVNLPFPSVQKLSGLYITPYNILELLDVHDCPKNCDFFKLDIDSYDGVILKKVMDAGYRPKMLQIEVNPEIPPPLSFCVLYDDKYRLLDKDGHIGGFYGASLSYVLDLCLPLGYEMAQLDFYTEWTHDVTLVHKTCRPVLDKYLGDVPRPASAREAYLAHPPAYSHFREYGIDSLPWRTDTDFPRLVKTVWNALLTSNTRKHEGHAVPFHLS